MGFGRERVVGSAMSGISIRVYRDVNIVNGELGEENQCLIPY